MFWQVFHLNSLLLFFKAAASVAVFLSSSTLSKKLLFLTGFWLWLFFTLNGLLRPWDELSEGESLGFGFFFRKIVCLSESVLDLPLYNKIILYNLHTEITEIFSLLLFKHLHVFVNWYNVNNDLNYNYNPRENLLGLFSLYNKGWFFYSIECPCLNIFIYIVF